jgi:hypothetical protein
VESLIRETVQRSRTAPQIIEEYSQEQADRLSKTIAKVVFDTTEKLARMAVEESGMGSYADKVQKNRGNARILSHSLRGKPSAGVISHDDRAGIIEIAKPMEVVGAIQPCSNQNVMPMVNVMAATKGRNTINIVSHPRTRSCTAVLISIIKNAWRPQHSESHSTFRNRYWRSLQGRMHRRIGAWATPAQLSRRTVRGVPKIEALLRVGVHICETTAAIEEAIRTISRLGILPTARPGPFAA